MEHDDKQVGALKEAVVGTFGRTLDAPTDFDLLSAEIRKSTGETISASTLKRLYGYIRPATAPRPSTLSALARYAGYAGWSDFCGSRESGTAVAETRRSARRRRRLLILSGTAALCILAFGMVAGVGPFRAAQGSADPVSPPETAGQRAERIAQRCVALAKVRCDSVRRLRPGMDIIAYREAVEEFYFPFVFTEMKDTVDRLVAEAFPDDTLLVARYRNEVFSLCRDFCVELLREIPSDELIRACRERQAK